MQDHTASTVALARVMLQSLDLQSVDSKVNTASLKLILDTFIDLAGNFTSPVPNAKGLSTQALESAARSTVAGRIAAIDLEANPPGGNRGGV